MTLHHSSHGQYLRYELRVVRWTGTEYVILGEATHEDGAHQMMRDFLQRKDVLSVEVYDRAAEATLVKRYAGILR